MESNKEEFLEATNTDLFNSFTVILKSSILKKAFFCYKIYTNVYPI